MTFTRLSDITLWDAITNDWVAVVCMFFAIVLGLAVALESREIGFSGFGDSIMSLGVIFWGLLIPLLMAGQAYNVETEQVKYENVTQAFDLTEDRFDIIEKDGANHRFDDEGFSDMRLTLTDNETRAVYDVTFGFEKSGEPFVYDRSDDVEFVEGLKK